MFTVPASTHQHSLQQPKLKHISRTARVFVNIVIMFFFASLNHIKARIIMIHHNTYQQSFLFYTALWFIQIIKSHCVLCSIAHFSFFNVFSHFAIVRSLNRSLTLAQKMCGKFVTPLQNLYAVSFSPSISLEI